MKYLIEGIKEDNTYKVSLKRLGKVGHEEQPITAERMEVDGYIESTFGNRLHYVPKSDLWMYEPRIEKKREGVIKTQQKIIERLKQEIKELKEGKK